MNETQPPLAAAYRPDFLRPYQELSVQAEIAKSVAGKIRTEGDALDGQPWLRRLPIDDWGTRITGGAAVGAVAMSPEFAPIVLAGVAAGSVAWRWAIKRGDYRQRAAERLSAMEEVGQAYKTNVEFSRYRDESGRHQLSLSWYAPEEKLEKAKLLEQLNGLQEIAKVGGVTWIHLPFHQVEHVVGGLGRRPVKHSSVPSGDQRISFVKREQDAQRILPVDQKELAQIIKRAAEDVDTSPLPTIMERLRSEQPKHPALHYYDTKQYLRLIRTLRGSYESRLVEVGSRLEFIVGRADGEIVEEPVRTRPVLNAQLTMQGGQPVAEYRAEDNLQHADSGTVGKGATLAELAAIIGNPKPGTSKTEIVQACELAAWLALKGQPIKLEGHSTQPLKESGDKTETPKITGVQERIIDKLLWREKSDVYLRSTYRRRLLRSGAALAVSLTLGTVLGNQPENVDFPDPTDLLPDFGGEPAPRATLSDSMSGVGNVLPKDSQPAYFLEMFGDADPEGYWVQNVSSTLILGESPQDDMFWQAREIYYNGEAEGVFRPLGKRDDLDTSQDLIKVQITLPPHEITTTGLDIPVSRERCNPDVVPCFAVEDGVAVPPLPVLLGGQIVSASLNGYEDTSVFIRPDGVQHIVLPHEEWNELSREESVTIEYWLTPTGGPAIRATDRLRVLTEQYSEKEVSLPELPAELNEQWEEYLGEPLPADPTEKLEVQESVIGHFNYELEPIPDEVDTGRPEDLNQATLDEEDAVCNTAGSVLGVNNRQLNYVSGFRYSRQGLDPDEYDDRYTALFTKQAHAWNVDPNGHPRDATPAGRGEDDSSEPEVPTAVKWLVGSALVAAMVGGGYKKRRVVTDRLDRRYLEGIDTRDLNMAAQAMDHLQFAPQGTPFEYVSRDEHSRAQALDHFADRANNRHYPTLRQTLKQATRRKSPLDTAYKTHLQDARRTLRATRR